MTNGEKIQHDFKCEVCDPIIEDNIIHVIFADKSDSAIGFDWDWWNLDYKESTTKNDLGVDLIDRVELLKAMDTWDKVVLGYDGFERWTEDCEKVPYVHYDDMVNCVKGMPSVTPQEPILDKIRAEIQFIKDKCLPNNIAEEYEQKGLQEALDIIDKYKAESED